MLALLAVLPLASCRAPFSEPSDGDCLEVQGAFDARAPGYIVLYREGVPVQATTQELAAKYGFTPKHTWEVGVQGFSAELSQSAVDGIRCESVVKLIKHDGVFTAA